MNRPMAVYAVSILFGCLSALCFAQNIIIGAVITASFLAVTFFTFENKGILALSYLFVLLGFLSFFMYYNVNVNKEITFRVTQAGRYYSSCSYNHRNIEVKGNLEKVGNGSIVKAAGSFDYQRDYGKGIIGTFTIKSIKSEDKDYLTLLYNIKSDIYKNLKQNISDKDTAIIMSVCFGDTEYLDINQKNEFQKLGIIHAISVSGFHMAIVYGIFEAIFGFEAGIAITGFYVLFTGIKPPSLRAFIIILVLKFSKKIFRNYDAISALSLSAIILLAFRPYYITDLGFQLSYLAALGIIFYYKRIRQKLWLLPDKLNASVSVTLSAQIFSLPYVIFTLGNFSPGFLLGNILLVPFYSALVVVGNAALLALKIKPLFNIIVFVLKLVMLTVNGGNYLLLKISPTMVVYTTLEALFFMLLYPCYIFTKRGYKQAQYIPLFLILFIMIQNYCIIPRITYFSSNDGDDVLIKYKNQSVLVVGSNKISSIRESYDRKVVLDTEKGCIIRIDREYLIKVSPFPQSFPKGKRLNVEVQGSGSKSILISGNINIENIDYKKYDIINVPNTNIKAYYETDVCNYWLVNGKIYGVSN